MKNTFLFERSLDSKVEEVIKRYSSGKQTLVFCGSKGGCERLSQRLSEKIRLPCDHRLFRDIENVQSMKVKNLVIRGHGFHHAGMPPSDRDIVEKLFKEGHIKILCATSTLAHGVNLPAHLVIIKVCNLDYFVFIKS